MSSSTALIQALHNPAVYPHDVDEVELIETHISWVLLTGQFAYKVKKPVDLGFVDFSTLEKRRQTCVDELRLNRRLAPELYLGLVSISGTVDEPVLSEVDQEVDGPIEYAVKMAQFPQSELLGQAIGQDLLTPQHIDRLAAHVADFHSRIAIADADSRFGTHDAVRSPAIENFRHIASRGDTTRQALIDQLQDWTEQECTTRMADFHQRKEQGKIRECHGDMHLGNMILHDGDVLLFDCLEFNADLRWIDVASEVAFLVMDLADRGRPDFAARFLNAYLEITGDYDGLALLPFYLVYRAMVRAKVACLRLAQGHLSTSEQQDLVQELDGYLRFAERASQPQDTVLIITHGFSGSGKTTLTQVLVDEWPAMRVRSDVERKRMFQRTDQQTSATDMQALYSQSATDSVYDRLAELGGSILASGFSVIVDATFLQRRHRDQLHDVARRQQSRFLIVDLQADVDVLQARIRMRQQKGGDASDADNQVLANQLQSHEPLGEDEQADVIVIASDDPQAGRRLLDACRKRLQPG